MAKSKKDPVDRRCFLKGAAAAATALVAKPEVAKAQQSDPRRPGAPSPTVKEVAAENRHAGEGGGANHRNAWSGIYGTS